MTASPILRTAAGLGVLIGEYTAVTPRSAAAHRRALAVLPGGQTRTITHYPPYPVFITGGQGARLVDLDGREYIDLVNNYTSLVHGTGFRPVIEAVAEQLPDGLAFPAPHLLQVRLAELLTARLPAVDQVRFTNSGTEAGVLAARVARKATGRRGIVMFEGGYHGSAPPLLESEPGTVAVPYNDLDRLQSVLDRDVAAVFAESFLGSGGVIPADPGFLAEVEGAARANGSLFVLDEVQSVRTDVHGVQGQLGLRPDLTLLGKVIGGGFPVGALGGDRALLSSTVANAPDGIRHAGTFNGHLASMVAGEVTLGHLDSVAIERLNAGAGWLADAITAQGQHAGLPVSVTRTGSILNVHFLADPPRRAVKPAGDTDAYTALHLGLLLDGVYTTPRAMINLSTALTPDDLQRVADAYAGVFERIATDPSLAASLHAGD